MEGFDVSALPMDLLLNILNIILLFIIVRALVYKPVKKFMAARTAKINDQIEKAKTEYNEAEKVKSDYKSLLKSSEQKAKQLILEGEEKARENASKIVAEANQKSSEILANARIRAEEERKASLASMQNDVADLAVNISEKILSREISDKDNRKIAEDFFSDKG